MEHAEVKSLLVREMPHTGRKRPLERPIIGPFGKGAIDVGVVDGRLASGVLRDWQALPLHPRIEYPQDEVKETMIAEFTLRTSLGHREVRQDKFGALRSESWTGLGVVTACFARVLMVHWPRVQRVDSTS
jgi:hypothetical protein